MGRTGSTYRARLVMVFHACLELQSVDGEVRVGRLAERVDLTERAVKDYLDDLSSLGVLSYRGAGRYVVNEGFVKSLGEDLLFEPSSSVVIDEGLLHAGLVGVEPVSRKVQRVLRKLEFPLVSGEEVRERLVAARVGDYVFPVRLLGDGLVLPRFAGDVLLDGVWVAGSAPAHSVHNFVLGDFSVLTVVCLSVGGFVGLFEGGVLDHERSVRRRIPDLHSFRGVEPFEEGDPFFEFSTDFPELLQAGRSIAARYLREIQHYRMGIRLVEEFGDKFDFYFRLGSLVPHGFLVASKVLVKLRDKCNRLFYDLVRVASEKGVTLVGVSPVSMDNVFFRACSQVLGKIPGKTNDLNFLSIVLRDGDSTCLIERGEEKGKPPVRDVYEFYLSRKGIVTKYEFVSRDPLSDHKRVADVAYTLTTAPLREREEAGPSVVSVARQEAAFNLSSLERSVELSLRAGFLGMLEKIQRRRDEERAKEAFGG
ncbi:MAG: hypothetical protein QXW47_10495 [Candidatus Jordarchaeales archaeon]